MGICWHVIVQDHTADHRIAAHLCALNVCKSKLRTCLCSDIWCFNQIESCQQVSMLSLLENSINTTATGVAFNDTIALLQLGAADAATFASTVNTWVSNQVRFCCTWTYNRRSCPFLGQWHNALYLLKCAIFVLLRPFGLNP